MGRESFIKEELEFKSDLLPTDLKPSDLDSVRKELKDLNAEEKELKKLRDEFYNSRLDLKKKNLQYENLKSRIAKHKAILDLKQNSDLTKAELDQVKKGDHLERKSLKPAEGQLFNAHKDVNKCSSKIINALNAKSKYR